MQKSAYRITVPASVSKDVLKLISDLDGKYSSPQPASSTADALNAPVTGGDIQAAAEVITAVFAAGSAALIFFDRLIIFSKSNKGIFKVSNAGSGKESTINEKTKPDDLV